MNEDPQGDDAQLLGAIRAAYDCVPAVPAELSEFARNIIDWADLDAEIARMTFDSGLERPVGLRSGGVNERALSYAGGELEIELTMLVDAAVGQITPAANYRVVLQTRSGDTETATDERGRFRLPPIRLPARLVVSGRAERVVTPWLTA